MKNILKAALIFVISSMTLATVGCAHTGAPGGTPTDGKEKTSRVRVYGMPSEVAAYGDAEVYIGQTRLPVYSVMVNTSQNWSGSVFDRRSNGVCMFELDGKAKVTVKPSVKIDYSSVVRPLASKLTPIADTKNNTLTVEFTSAGEYVLEINADKYNAIHFFVSDYDESGADKYSGYERIEVFEAGLHTAQNDNRIDASNNNCINVPSNTLVYLADGAVVRGRFYAQNAQNIGIAGRGIIDGSAFVRDASRNIVTVPIEFNYCTDVALDDFFILDPAGWSISSYFCKNVGVDGIKIISSRSNGDGISVQSCSDVTVKDCFIRTWDDSLVVKNYPQWEDRTRHGETDNVAFSDCVLWTDLAQSMEIGYETVGVKFQDVRFENITILHALHLAPISVHNANNAEIKNVIFKDITIEDCALPASQNKLIDFRVLYSSNWSDQHTSPTPLGNVDGVVVENLKVLGTKKFAMTIGGCFDRRQGFESEHYVSNVTIKNFSVSGARPQKDDCSIVMTDAAYVRGLEIVQNADAQVTGALFKPSQTAEYLSEFGSVCDVQKVNINNREEK